MTSVLALSYWRTCFRGLDGPATTMLNRSTKYRSASELAKRYFEQTIQEWADLLHCTECPCPEVKWVRQSVDSQRSGKYIVTGYQQYYVIESDFRKMYEEDRARDVDKCGKDYDLLEMFRDAYIIYGYRLVSDDIAEDPALFQAMCHLIRYYQEMYPCSTKHLYPEWSDSEDEEEDEAEEEGDEIEDESEADESFEEEEEGGNYEDDVEDSESQYGDSSEDNVKSKDDKDKEIDWILLNPSRRSRALISTVIPKNILYNNEWNQYNDGDASSSCESSKDTEEDPQAARKRKADEFEEEEGESDGIEESLPTFGLSDALKYLSKKYDVGNRFTIIESASSKLPEKPKWKKVRYL